MMRSPRRSKHQRQFNRIVTLKRLCVVFSFGWVVFTYHRNHSDTKGTNTTKRRIPDDLIVNFNAQIDTLKLKYKMKPVRCEGHGLYTKANRTVLMHDTGMEAWICSENKSSEEWKVSKVMMSVFEKSDPGSLMLDIGANTGYYSLLAAKLGHKCVQFDLQPECQNILRNSVLANGFEKQVTTVSAGVSDVKSSLDVPIVGCDGQFPQAEPVKDAPMKAVNLYRLGHFLDIDGDDIMMMKVDTEGNEKRVLEGSKEFFSEKKIKNAIVEITPCCKFWEKAGIQAVEVQQIVGEIVSYGYVMVSLWDYKIFRTAKEAEKYLQAPPFEQSDMWFTLEEDIISLNKDAGTVPLKPDEKDWYI